MALKKLHQKVPEKAKIPQRMRVNIPRKKNPAEKSLKKVPRKPKIPQTMRVKIPRKNPTPQKIRKKL